MDQNWAKVLYLFYAFIQISLKKKKNSQVFKNEAVYAPKLLILCTNYKTEQSRTNLEIEALILKDIVKSQ